MKGVIIFETITLEDERYPEQLRKIQNPPKQLYCVGNIELLKSNIISIVGSRICSEKGIRLTRKFAKELVYQEITIASGMAIGIDTIAHKTALQVQGKTIAILPSGLNKVYPKQNLELYRQIIKKQGLIITEYMADEEADSKKFLQRNRIVSGIALRNISNRGNL